MAEPDTVTGLPELSGERLRGASVLIAGAGNIGSPLASFLARCGVRLLRVIDRDRVEPKNLLMQDYRPQDVGRPKAEALAERLRQQAPNVAIEAHAVDLEDVPLGLFAVDVILGALDSRRARQLLVSEIAWPLGVPVVDGGVGEGWRGRVQVFVPTAGTACLECTWGAADYRRLAVEYPCIPGASAEAAPTVSPAFAGAAVAAVMVAEGVKLLAGPLLGMSQEIAFDLFHRRHLTARLRRAPGCRFGHEVVRERWHLDRPFDRATVADLLATIERHAGPGPAHLECRRGLLAPVGFAPAGVLALDELKRRANEPLTALGLTAVDRVRVRRKEGSAFLLLNGE